MHGRPAHEWFLFHTAKLTKAANLQSAWYDGICRGKLLEHRRFPSAAQGLRGLFFFLLCCHFLIEVLLHHDRQPAPGLCSGVKAVNWESLCLDPYPRSVTNKLCNSSYFFSCPSLIFLSSQGFHEDEGTGSVKSLSMILSTCPLSLSRSCRSSTLPSVLCSFNSQVRVGRSRWRFTQPRSWPSAEKPLRGACVGMAHL